LEREERGEDGGGRTCEKMYEKICEKICEKIEEKICEYRRERVIYRVGNPRQNAEDGVKPEGTEKGLTA
jgi:hypothetical protein